MGFQRSVSEPTLYFKKSATDILIVCLYVDDLIFMGSNKKMNEEFKTHMMDEFDMKDLGLMSYFLGLEVHQTPIATPTSHGEHLCKEDGEPKVEK